MLVIESLACVMLVIEHTATAVLVIELLAAAVLVIEFPETITGLATGTFCTTNRL